MCGRSFEEIGETRRLIAVLADLACVQGYDNVDDFAAHVARKLDKAVWHRRARG